MPTPRVAIAGGGLAGLSCAKYLVDAGFRVAILEGLPYLGGRASTYLDSDGDWIEQGLHLFLGTYSEFKKLLRDIGRDPDRILFWMDELRFQDIDGDEAVFGINPIRAPLRTFLGLLLDNDYLSPMDKLSIALMLVPALRSHQVLRVAYDDETVTDLWEQVNRRARVLERFLRPVCRALQFTDPDQFSAYAFLGLIHNVLQELPSALAGGYRGPRDELIFAPLARHLETRGATIRTGAKLGRIELARPRDHDALNRRVASFILQDGERIEADLFVTAMPVWALLPLIPKPLKRDPFFKDLSELPICPAISAQLWFDRKVTSHPDFTLVAGGPISVYQEQSTSAYPFEGGSRISAIVAPADELIGCSKNAILKLIVESLCQVLPSVARAKVLKAVILKHKHHLVRPLPGAMSQRPSQVTSVPNWFLAGDWTEQAYFGSQEGAVRSGKACSQRILRYSRAANEGELIPLHRVSRESPLKKSA